MDPKVLSELMKDSLTDANLTFLQITPLSFQVISSTGREIIFEVFANNEVDAVAYRVSGAIPGQVTEHLDKAIKLIKGE